MSEQRHWASRNERGTAFFLELTRLIVRYCPLQALKIITFFVVLYFYLTAGKARSDIAEYQQNLTACYPGVKLKKPSVFRQFLAFGEAITDRFAVWQRKIRYTDVDIDDAENLYAEMDSSERGQILLCSHFGNVEICRALLNSGQHADFKLNVLVHSKHAEAFNRALAAAGANELPLIQVEDLDVQKMLELGERLEHGEWIAIAADRVPVRGDKTQAVEFLGKFAEFPEGAWLLASILKAKLNTVFVVKEKGRYHLKLRQFSEPITGRGKAREEKIRQAMQQYANLLADECAKNPLQWFNFYDFWQQKNGE